MTVRELPVLAGTMNDGRRRLSEVQKKIIKKSTQPLRKLAEKFGVSRSTISRIRSGKKQVNYNNYVGSNNEAVKKTRKKKKSLGEITEDFMG